ncbi:MAG: non-hydrolyzing UDP-N-acetylglucosamine 2-epimerase [Gammaproteobacteria bacterium]
MRALTVVGARPQFVKLAPVSRAMADLARDDGATIEDIIVHTGQHYDPGMSDVFFDELEIPRPAIDLGVGSGAHGVQTARMLAALEQAMLDHQPDIVVIYGDTNSTMAGAIAAAKLNIPIAHIEAGLRSFDRAMPEENNRVVADHLSDLLFAPTETAIKNLAKENLSARTHLVGDVMLDAVRFNTTLARDKSSILADLDIVDNRFGVATLHRAANTDTDRLGSLLEALNRVSSDLLPIIFPAHPRTVARIEEICPDWCANSQLRLIDPVSYLDMLKLLDEAQLVLTDSGGLQKEALFLGAPCVTLRDETEWPETISAGGNILAGADPDKIAGAAASQIDGRKQDGGKHSNTPFGDGHAAQKIVSEMMNFLHDQCRN